MKRPFYFNGTLTPKDSFMGEAKGKKDQRVQFELLTRATERLREIGTVVSRPHCNASHAHSLLDDLIQLCQSGHTRFSDIHMRDTGISHHLAQELEDAGIYTIKDVANSCPSKLPPPLTTLDLTTAAITALRRVLVLEEEKQCA